tara:strand:+ start:341 stop:547 length:207 start_codon:yes stop_codon:yes gene_type:complete
MKIGDLVELSAYARKLKSADYWYSKAQRNGVGIVVGFGMGFIDVMWSGKARAARMQRREIKIASKAKR